MCSWMQLFIAVKANDRIRSDGDAVFMTYTEKYLRAFKLSERDFSDSMD